MDNTHLLLGIKDILAFILEMLALAFWTIGASRWGGQSWQRWVFGLLSLALFVSLWALFFSPKAAHRLNMPWLFIGKLLILGLPVLLFPGLLKQPWSLVYGAALGFYFVIALLTKTL